jgi:hypothetical protein
VVCDSPCVPRIGRCVVQIETVHEFEIEAHGCTSEVISAVCREERRYLKGLKLIKSCIKYPTFGVRLKSIRRIRYVRM